LKHKTEILKTATWYLLHAATVECRWSAQSSRLDILQKSIVTIPARTPDGKSLLKPANDFSNVKQEQLW